MHIHLARVLFTKTNIWKCVSNFLYTATKFFIHPPPVCHCHELQYAARWRLTLVFSIKEKFQLSHIKLACKCILIMTFPRLLSSLAPQIPNSNRLVLFYYGMKKFKRKNKCMSVTFYAAAIFNWLMSWNSVMDDRVQL